MSEANKKQVGGKHYAGVLQHWDLAVIFNWDYLQGQVIKYVMRWRDKGGIQDLEKGLHNLEKYIEVEKLKLQGDLAQALLRAALGETGGGEQTTTGIGGMTYTIDTYEITDSGKEILQAKEDAKILGIGWLKLYPNGSMKRVHPAAICIDIKKDYEL